MKKYSYIIFLLLISGFGLAACERPSPKELLERNHLPSSDYVADIERGSRSFELVCAKCHGSKGRGSNQGPALVHKTYRPGHHADLAFHWAVKNGVQQHHWHFGNMPPISGVSPETVSDIVAYIRAEQRKVGIK